MSKIYANGNAEVVIPAAEKIAVFSNSPISIYEKVGFPNIPSAWELIYATAAGETYTSAAFASGATLRVNASASDAFYEVGSAPVIGEPLADQTFADATGIIQGLAAAQGGSATLKGGTSSTAGNAGGAAYLTGGQPGTTGVGGAANVTGGVGGATSGAGGAANITGGAASAGNSDGGSVNLTPGAKSGSGIAGVVRNEGMVSHKQGAPATATVAATLTVAQMKAGYIVATHPGTGNVALTLPTGTDMDAAMPAAFSADDSFDISIYNLGVAAAADTYTLTAGATFTIVGNAIIPGNHAASLGCSTATFRCRKTAANTYVAYRLS